MAHIKAHKRRNLKLGAVAAYGLFTYRGAYYVRFHVLCGAGIATKPSCLQPEPVA